MPQRNPPMIPPQRGGQCGRRPCEAAVREQASELYARPRRAHPSVAAPLPRRPVARRARRPSHILAGSRLHCAARQASHSVPPTCSRRVDARKSATIRPEPSCAARVNDEAHAGVADHRRAARHGARALLRAGGSSRVPEPGRPSTISRRAAPVAVGSSAAVSAGRGSSGSSGPPPRAGEGAGEVESAKRTASASTTSELEAPRFPSFCSMD